MNRCFSCVVTLKNVFYCLESIHHDLDAPKWCEIYLGDEQVVLQLFACLHDAYDSGFYLVLSILVNLQTTNVMMSQRNYYRTFDLVSFRSGSLSPRPDTIWILTR